MESLISPKIVVGVHCQKLRTKGMYIPAMVDPDEATFYDKYETSAYWCAIDADRLWARPRAGATGCVLQRTGLLQALTALRHWKEDGDPS